MPFSEYARRRRRESQFLQGALKRELDIEHYVKTGHFRYGKKTCSACALEKKRRTKKMRSFRKNKRGVLYIFAVILVGLIVVPVAWYILMFNVLGEFRSASNTVIFALGTNSTQQGYTDSFFSNLITYILVLFLFGIAYWAYTYAQRATGTVYVQ